MDNDVSPFPVQPCGPVELLPPNVRDQWIADIDSVLYALEDLA